GVVAFLDEKARSPTQNVRAEDGFHGVEYPGMEDQVVEAGEFEVALVANDMPRNQSAAALEILDAGAHVGGLAGGQRGHGENVAILAILRDLRRVQIVTHTSSFFIQTIAALS